MRDPHHYTRALAICQGTMTAVYITVGCVVYYYCGSYVASPALGSAGKIMKKVCYGLALPGLIVTTMLYVHVRGSLGVATTSLTSFLAFSKVFFYTLPPRLPTSYSKYLCSLGDLDKLHCWQRRRRLHHR